MARCCIVPVYALAEPVKVRSAQPAVSARAIDGGLHRERDPEQRGKNEGKVAAWHLAVLSNARVSASRPASDLH